MTKPIAKKKPAPAAAASDYSGLLGGVSELLEAARRASARAVNALMTATYWEIGRRIVEFEQQGKDRAEYGKELLKRLAGDLTASYGRGFSVDNLENMRLFYGVCGSQEISETLSRKLGLASPDPASVAQKSQTPSGKSPAPHFRKKAAWEKPISCSAKPFLLCSKSSTPPSPPDIMPEPTQNRTNKTNATNASHPSSPSPPSHSERVIPAHGGYEDLLSFQKARIIHDATVKFCARFVDKRSRTTDQMIQAARSGKQNILEGSQVSGTSKEAELKLTNVARASLEELLEDYRDYLRQNGHPQWDKNSKEARYVRKLGAEKNASYESYQSFIETRPPEIVANILICLIHQTNYLLDQQLRRLEQDFLKEGGLRERMTRARLATRNQPPRRGPHTP